MKGYIMLSEGRSGSNWLGSMTNKTKKLGRLTEWLGAEWLDNPPAKYSAGEIFTEVMEKSSSPNGRFAIKIFPRHMHNIHHNVGFDFIRKCLNENDTTLVALQRRDTLGQAISFVRGIQSRQWTSRAEKKGEVAYDFGAICRAYFYINRSNQYWEAYLGVNGYDHRLFYYEDLIGDPSEYLNHITNSLGVDEEFDWSTDLKIQRDDTTQEWRDRFQDEIKTHDIIGFTGSFGGYQSFSLETVTAKLKHKAGGGKVLNKLKAMFP